MNEWRPVVYEKVTGSLRVRVAEEAGTGKWVARMDLAGLNVGGSLPMDTQEEAMDWADAYIINRFPAEHSASGATPANDGR